MLVAILNLLIYYIAYSYILIVLISFFHPITSFISLAVLFFSCIFSVMSMIFLPLREFYSRPYKTKINLMGIFTFSIIILWFSIVISRVSRDTDTNVYHLPLALLMNHSIWYPGIGMLSLVMAFANGTSVLASLFTSFNVPGLEFIPGFIIWIIFGIGIYLYLLKKEINTYIAFVVASMFLLTPGFFWESYNMGTDMPLACFLSFGLLALLDKNYKDAALFFALSSIFKPLGQLVFLIFISGFIVFLLLNRDIKKLRDFKIIVALVIFIIASLRLYIATGNPFYPAVAIKLTPWGIDVAQQKSFFDGAIRGWVKEVLEKSQSSFLGFLSFLRDFFISPNRIKSSNWFSPFFLSCLLSFSYLLIRDKKYREISFNSWLTIILTSFLIVGWFLNAPLVRFIAGVLVFLSLVFFSFSLNKKVPVIFKVAIYFSIFFTLTFFTINVYRHFREFIVPMFSLSPRESERHMSFSQDIFSIITMKDKFAYTVSKSSYCGRSRPPCLHAYSIGDRNKLIETYKQHNRKFLFKFKDNEKGG